ncbi:MAG: PEP-CTERM sorting domain-containing protein [Planctomycetota bacterium]
MKRSLLAAFASLVCAATAFAGLDTATYVGPGVGSLTDDSGTEQAYAPGNLDGLPYTAPFTGDLPVTIKDASGGDLWNGGDAFMYLHDDDQYSEPFTAQVRVISQTKAVDGRWGKAGIHARSSLDPNASNAMAQIAAGNGSQTDAPTSGADHSPVPARLGGRLFNTGNDGFEYPIFHDGSSPLEDLDLNGEVDNNFFQESAPVNADGSVSVTGPNGTSSIWLQLEYLGFDEFRAGIAEDVNGAPGTWQYSNTEFLEPDADGAYYVGLGYSLHGDFTQHLDFPEEWFHGITFDNYSITPDTTSNVDGDFNNDGAYDCADIDALTGDIAAGSNTASFDLTGDGNVDLADRDAWLSEAGEANLGPGKSYLVGDGSLDGVVDVSDFGIWNANKFTNNDAWCSGDFNADGVVDVSDFGAWNANKFTASDAAAPAAVPEPSTLALLIPAGLLFALRRRRR